MKLCYHMRPINLRQNFFVRDLFKSVVSVLEYTYNIVCSVMLFHWVV
ncbi:hypothetical protein LMG33818_002177 [Halomonadaceae bacterium LMG 33818]